MERDVGIDILKTIAILLIILAHVCNNNIIYQLRNFDVILLIIISGILARKEKFVNKKDILKYYKKRFLRIVLPVWVFLIILFIGNNVANQFGLGREITYFDIINSFLFTNEGIRYTWIVRIFILIALILPLETLLKENLSARQYWSIMLGCYFLYEISYNFNLYQNIKILDLSINYLVPYALLVFSIGLYLEELSDRRILITLTISLICYFLLFVINGMKIDEIEILKSYKYPPRLYYLLYGIGMSLLIYYLVKRRNIFNIEKRGNNKIVNFIAQNSYEIYLCHIIFLQFTIKLEEHEMIRYCTVLSLTLITVYIYKKIYKKCY